MNADLHHLAAAYALDALDDDERAAFEAHYPSCGICRTEVEQFTETAGMLAGATETHPPSSLRASVLDAIEGVSQEPAPQENPATLELEAPTDADSATVLDMAASPAARRRWSPRAVLGVAAAVVGLLVAGVVITDNFANEATDPVTAIAEADDAISVPLEGDAEVRVVYSPSHSEAALVAEGIAQLDPDRVYELWAVAGDEVIRAGEFVPNDAGRLEGLIDNSRFDLDDVAAWAITIEPEGGVDVATTDPVFLGET